MSRKYWSQLSDLVVWEAMALLTAEEPDLAEILAYSQLSYRFHPPPPLLLCLCLFCPLYAIHSFLKWVDAAGMSRTIPNLLPCTFCQISLLSDQLYMHVFCLSRTRAREPLAWHMESVSKSISKALSWVLCYRFLTGRAKFPLLEHNRSREEHTAMVLIHLWQVLALDISAFCLPST